MKKEDHLIIGIHILDRVKIVGQMQQIFTEYGCHIKTRLGLHDVSEEYCSATGVVLLEMFGDDAKLADFEAKINAIDGIEVQKMVFKHPDS